MEVYKTPSKEIQEIILANVTYEAIIKGLNGYFASEPRNDYITVKIEFDDIKQDFALYEAEAWADILITWLRTEHGIFYYPGMEADLKKAKAINEQLKKDTDLLIDTALEKKIIDSAAAEELRNLLFNDVVEVICQECYDRGLTMNSYNAEACIMRKKIEDLELKLKDSQKSDVNALIRDYCTKNDIIAPSRYFSEKACVEYLFSVINLKQKDHSFAILQDLYRDIFKKQPDGLSAEDIANKILDKVLETADLLHKSVDSVNKECKATGKLMVADYEKDLLQFIYKEYKGRIHLSDETITYNPPSVRNTVLKIISDYARCRTRNDILETRIKSIFDRCKTKFTVDDYVLNGDPTSKFMLDCISSWISSPAESRGKVRAEIENYKLKLKSYILKDIKKHGYRYDGLETKSIEEIVDRIIQIATCPRNEWAYCEIKNLRSHIDTLKGLINAMNEEVKDM